MPPLPLPFKTRAGDVKSIIEARTGFSKARQALIAADGEELEDVAPIEEAVDSNHTPGENVVLHCMLASTSMGPGSPGNGAKQRASEVQPLSHIEEVQEA